MLVVEGPVKYRDKKWKQKWCKLELMNQEDEGDTMIVTLFKLSENSRKPLTHHSKVVKIPHFSGLHTDFVLDKEQNTICLVGSQNIFILSLQDEDTQQLWKDNIKSSVQTLGDCYDMFMVGTPRSSRIGSVHFVKLFLLDDHLSMISLSPVRHVTAWKVSSVEEFGLRDGDRFYLKGPTLHGKGNGEFIFQSSLAADLARAMTNRQKMLEGLTDATVKTSAKGCPGFCVPNSRLSQPLNFYEDLYLQSMYRSSNSSLNSNSCDVQSRHVNHFTSTKSLQDYNGCVSKPVRPKTVFVTSMYRYKPQLSDTKSNSTAVMGIYDTPPSRPAVSLYDVPPSHRTSVNHSMLNSTKPALLYDKVPPPRCVSTSSKPSQYSQLYDTPPHPKPLKSTTHTEVSLTSHIDASPKCKADYNSALKYVDLSKYDGTTTSCGPKKLEPHIWGRCQSYDPDLIYINSCTAKTFHMDQANIYDELPCNPRPISSGEPRSCNKKRQQRTMHQQPSAVTTQQVRHTSSDKHECDKPYENVYDIHDDGYVLVSESAVIESPRRPTNIKMRNSKELQQRRASVDSNSWRCSADSGRMTSSNTSLSSYRRRESCSSYSGGSHLSLVSPSKTKSACQQTLSDHRRVVSSTSSSQDYMNVSFRDHMKTVSNSDKTTPDSSFDINYADLDFSISLEDDSNKQLPPEKTKLELKGCTAESSDAIEYVKINIVATEALRKASEEHNKYRLNKHAIVKAH